MKSPYELELHESIEIDGWIITAVPGGWIYKSFTVAVFVPNYGEPEEKEPEVNEDDQAFTDAIVQYINDTLSGKTNEPEGHRLIRSLLRNAHS